MKNKIANKRVHRYDVFFEYFDKDEDEFKHEQLLGIPMGPLKEWKRILKEEYPTITNLKIVKSRIDL
jgi:hypothetical protein